MLFGCLTSAKLSVVGTEADIGPSLKVGYSPISDITSDLPCRGPRRTIAFGLARRITVGGHGGRIRNSAWRNQNPEKHIDLISILVRMLHPCRVKRLAIDNEKYAGRFI